MLPLTLDKPKPLLTVLGKPLIQYTFEAVPDEVTAHDLMEVIGKKARKGSVYYTDKFRSYNTLKRLDKHHTVNHYRGVSKYHFPMYLKEVAYRYNHRHDNVFKLFISIYFGYVSD